MTDKSHIDVRIDWPQLIMEFDVAFGVVDFEYDIEDMIQIEGKDIELIEVCDTGIILEEQFEDGDIETHHIDLRDVIPESREVDHG